MELLQKHPKVSVITTVYNAVSTIEDTIVSVLNQTYQNIEYIIIDGGSTDGTLQIINKYKDQLSHFISEPDNGIADGFNKGIALATGDWIGMINADDWYELDTVEVVMSNRKNDDKIFCGDLRLIGKNDIRQKKKSRVSWLNYGMYIMHPTCFVHTEVYQTVGLYDTHIRIAIDFDMYMRIRKAGFAIKYINRDLANMRIGGASGNIKKVHLEELAIMRKYLSSASYFFAYTFNSLNLLRWRYFCDDTFKA